MQLRSKTIDSWTNAEDGQRPDHPHMTSALRVSASVGRGVGPDGLARNNMEIVRVRGFDTKNQTFTFFTSYVYGPFRVRGGE